MDKYFNIMVIPEREKGVRSFRVPRLLFKGASFIFALLLIVLSIFIYDYWKILRQVYQNKHLTIENNQLKEQIQLFQMKLNTLTEEIERIHTFEKKLRIISGIEGDLQDTQRLTSPIMDNNSTKDKNQKSPDGAFININLKEKLENKASQPEYKELKTLYEKKIATTFGMVTGYTYTKEWSKLNQQSFLLAEDFAQFDYSFNILSGSLNLLESKFHGLDQFLLDRDAFLKSIPTLIPTRGWITSYYGMRKSPISGRIKMHEGIDVGAKVGSPVIAPADGIVRYTGTKPGFGVFVELDHGYGIETIFGHLKSANTKKGDIVKRGEVIAKIGNTGMSTGPHVHYEIRVNGTPVDPLYYVLD